VQAFGSSLVAIRVVRELRLEHLQLAGEQLAQRQQRVAVIADRGQRARIIEQRRFLRSALNGRGACRRFGRERNNTPEQIADRREAGRLQQRGGESGRVQRVDRRCVELGARGDRRRFDAFCAQRSQQSDAVATGHSSVEQEQIDALLARDGECRGRVACSEATAAGALQRRREEGEADRIVIDNQRAWLGCYHWQFHHIALTVLTRRSRSTAADSSIVEVDIVDLSHDGRGVARIDGKAVFVSGALSGERVRVRRTGKHRHYDEATVEAIVQPSADRVTPRCAHFGVCGGCALQHLSASAQIAAKQHVLLENLERIGKVRPATILPALTDEPWGYRRKARLGVKFVDKKGRVLVGFRETNGRYIADIKRCEVLHPAVGERIEAIAALLESLDACRTIPQIEVAAGDDRVALIFRHLHPLSDRDTQALAAFGRSHDLAIYLQPGGIDSVAPLEPGDAALSFRLPAFDLEIEFRPLDFIQVNAGMNRRMIEHALALLAPRRGDRALDLFCGLGNFTLPLARSGADVVGVEGEAGLVSRAADNARRNKVENARFYTADLAADQRDTAWAKADYDLMLLDPPRSGAAEVLEYLPGKKVRRVVYVSCHPGSLARDAGILVERHGFDLVSAGVMDMFPHTAHVESIALFERRG